MKSVIVIFLTRPILYLLESIYGIRSKIDKMKRQNQGEPLLRLIQEEQIGQKSKKKKAMDRGLGAMPKQNII